MTIIDTNTIHVNYVFVLSVDQTWICSTYFTKNSQNKVSRKSVYWGPSCSGWTDGQTVITKLFIARKTTAFKANYSRSCVVETV